MTLDETFNKVVMKHYNEIFHYIRKQTSNDEDAKDLTQDVFMKVYSKLNTYNKNLASLRTWIYRIAHHHVMNHFKKASTRYVKTLDQEFFKNLSTDDDVLEAMIQHEDVVFIKGLMNKHLNKKHHKMMNLYFFSSLTVKEIALSLKVPEKTVYNTLSLSINKLKREMEVRIHG